MKKHQFYKRYANIPIGSRHIVGIGTVANGFKDNKSPYEIYTEMIELDHVIEKARVRQEELLELAPNILDSHEK